MENQTFEEITTTAEIPAVGIPYFAAEIDKLNKRARKLDVPEISWQVTGRHKEPIHGEIIPGTGGRREVIGHRWICAVEIVGQSPKLAGWELAGVIEHHDAGNLLRGAGKGVDLMKWAKSGPTCDHCNLQRNRLETVVLIHESGKVARVGKSCLRDYLGHVSISALAWRADFAGLLGSIEDTDPEAWGGMYGSSGPDGWDLPLYLEQCAAEARLFGYVTRSAAKEREGLQATADRAAETLWLRTYKRSDYRKALDRGTVAEITKADEQQAAAALAWLPGELESAKSTGRFGDFLNNLEVIAGLDYIGHKNQGFACAILGAHRRAMAWEDERRAKEIAREAREAARLEKAATMLHVGAVGEKWEGVVTVQRVHVFHSEEWGNSYLIAMETHKGHAVTWKASTDPEWPIGAIFTIRGTVKAHDTYRDTPQTKLSHCAVKCPICNESGKYTKTGRLRKNGAPFKALHKCGHFHEVPESQGGGQKAPESEAPAECLAR